MIVSAQMLAKAQDFSGVHSLYFIYCLSLSLSLPVSFFVYLSASLPWGLGFPLLKQRSEEDSPEDLSSEHGAALIMESFTQKSLVSSPEVIITLFYFSLFSVSVSLFVSSYSC